MRCADLTKMSVFVCGPKDSVARCAQAMRRHNIGFLPVVGEERRLVGVVTDRDLTLRVLAEGRAATTPVADVMTREVIVCRLEENLHLAAERMVAHKVSRLPVLDEADRCAGVLNLDDVAQAESHRRVGELFQDLTHSRVVQKR